MADRTTMLPRHAAIRLAPRSAGRFAVSLCILMAVAGCSGAPDLAQLTIPGEATRVAASPTEVYMRIARGANVCWFGPRGRITHSHVFHADAEPPAKGGKVEIVVHVRDRQGERPWGAKAFRVVLSPIDTQTEIGTENLKMPEPEAEQMRRDALRWATGSTECVHGDAPLATPAARPGPTPAVAAPAPSR